MAATVATAAIGTRQLIGDPSDRGTGSAGGLRAGRLVLSSRAAAPAHRNFRKQIWARRAQPYWRVLRRADAADRPWARRSPGSAAQGYRFTPDGRHRPRRACQGPGDYAGSGFNLLVGSRAP